MKHLFKHMVFLTILLTFPLTWIHAQITIQMKNKPASEVVKQIEKVSKYRFFYKKGLPGMNTPITVEADNQGIETVMGQVVKQISVSYTIKGETQVVLTELAFQNTATSQNKIVKGTITDTNGEPIIGANVVEKGTTNGTITDVGGKYSLTDVSGKTLQISYIGYISQEVTIKEGLLVDVVLIEDTQKLDEVVVVGYGVQKKVNLTGSIASVAVQDINNVPVSNLSNALAGRAPGVVFNNPSGLAGTTSSIRIRGSFDEPLYVINGVIRDKEAFDALSAEEVENINILKDAASASIYGLKAGNGVVLVTTKKGSKQKPKFQYKGSYSISTPTKNKLPGDYTATDELLYANRVAEYNNSILAEPDPNFKVPNGPEVFEYFKDKNYDINDMAWQNPWSHSHNISVNGGGDQIIYYMNAGMHGEESAYKNTDFNRFNFRADITANITKYFKVNANVSMNQRVSDRFYWWDDMDGNESLDVGDFYGWTIFRSRLYPCYVDEYGNPSNWKTDYPVSVDGVNPAEVVFGDNYIKTKHRDLDGILRFDLDLGKYIKGLSVAVLGQYHTYDANRKAFVQHNQGYVFNNAGDPNNPYKPAPVDLNKTFSYGFSSFENIEEQMWQNYSYQLNGFINYMQSFGKHNVVAMLAYEQAGGGGKNIYGKAEEFLAPVDQIIATSTDPERRHFNGGEYEEARLAFVGRLNYNFNDKYIAEFSFRNDGNSKFASDYRYGFFPSGSLAWRISQENFFKVGWIDNLKIRGSYGTTGDDGGYDVAAFGWRNKFMNSTGFVFGDKIYPGIAVGSVPNPYLTWATLKVWDAGVDFGFLDNRLTGEVDFFSKTKSDILQTRVASLPDTYGRGKAEENYAKQRWTGYEVSLQWRDTYRDLDYTIYGNMGYAKDKWLIYDEASNLPGWKSVIGHPKDFLKGYVSEGIIRTQGQLDAILVKNPNFTQFGQKPRLGQILFKDIRGANESGEPDGVVDANDWDYLSRKAVPRINFGFGFNLKWRGIALDAHFQGVGDYDKMVKTRHSDGVFQSGVKPHWRVWTDDVWTPENPNSKYPAISGVWNEVYGAGPSDFWMRSGAYLRLKNLNISYTLPKIWFENIGLSDVKVYGNATNLFCLSAFKEYDPDQLTMAGYPVMKSFTFGLNLSF